MFKIHNFAKAWQLAKFLVPSMISLLLTEPLSPLEDLLVITKVLVLLLTLYHAVLVIVAHTHHKHISCFPPVEACMMSSGISNLKGEMATQWKVQMPKNEGKMSVKIIEKAIRNHIISYLPKSTHRKGKSVYTYIHRINEIFPSVLTMYQRQPI